MRQLKSLCEELDSQIQDYEEMNREYEQKESQWKQDRCGNHLFYFKKKLRITTSPFCGATEFPVLDFWVSSLVCVLLAPCAMDSSDSPLLRHLLASWQLAWQPSRFIHVLALAYKHC